MYRAYAAGTELATADIREELAHTTPLSRTRAEDITAMRLWSQGRATPATNPDAAPKGPEGGPTVPPSSADTPPG
jgi:hypothetical protein